MSDDESVAVVYRKFDNSLHWHHRMRRLGEDLHGVWLGAPAGTITRKGEETEVVLAQPHVLLIPRDAWWTAAFNGPPAHVEIYCDITTVPRWPHPGEVTMVDLDLDVIRERADGWVELLDEDEFAEHRIRYGYPADVIAAAWASAEWLQRAISGGSQPFASDYRDWLALA